MAERFRLKTDDWIDEPDRKRELNKSLFRVVAKRYAFVTRALSFGRDRAWKRMLVDALPEQSAPEVLDLACGPGDITFPVAVRYPAGQVLGLDICDAMIDLARTKSVPKYQVCCWGYVRYGSGK